MKVLKMIMYFLLGAGAGLTAGYLTAPNSGKKTRKKLVNEIESQKENMEEIANRKLEEAKEILNKTVKKQAENSKRLIDNLAETVRTS